MSCEVLQVLQLSDTAIIPISHHVPRKVRGALARDWGGKGGVDLGLVSSRSVPHQAVEFHEDLFPDTAGSVPASDAHMWWAGDNQQVRPALPHAAPLSSPGPSNPWELPFGSLNLMSTLQRAPLYPTACASLNDLPTHRSRRSASTQPADPTLVSRPPWCPLWNQPLTWSSLQRCPELTQT